jgi:hypothetical protein
MVIQSFLLISILYGKQYSYESCMAAFLEKYFCENSIKPETLQEIMSLKGKMWGKKKYRKHLI